MSIANNKKQFKEKGYCIVRSAVSFEIADFVTQYALFSEMQQYDGTDDGQVINSYSKYADPAMETLLARLHKTMEKNTGLELHPTYSYYRVYHPGAELVKHTDRPSCEISCTLCFNYSYNDNEYNWPIFIKENKANLKPGDMVIYRGIDLPHWREPFNIADKEAWHVQGFFHYVNKNGPHADWKFDKRTSLGLAKLGNENKKSKFYIQYTE